jgi:hypothetical protein
LIDFINIPWNKSKLDKWNFFVDQFHKLSNVVQELIIVKLHGGVTRKGLAEQGFYGCAFCVNARFTDQGSRINPAVTFIDEGSGIYPF